MLFHKQRKRDQPAGRSRSHDVFETGELYSQVRKFRTLPHQEGEYLDGTSGSRDAREEKARDPRESCLSAGEEKLRAEGFRCYRAAQEGENLGPNLGELFLAREEKTLAENSGELSVTGPAGGENPQNSVVRPTETIPAATARVRVLNVPPSCCCSYDSILPIKCQLLFPKYIHIIHIYKIV